MRTNFNRLLRRLLAGSSAGALALLLAATPAWSQAPDTKAKDTKDAAKAAKDTAKDAAKDTKNAAKDAAKDTKDTAKDARDTVKDTSKDVRDSAKDTTKDTRDTVRETSKTARDGAKDVRDSAKETAKDARDTVRDTGRDVRDATRDTRETVKEGAREVRDTVRDTAREVRGGRNARTFRAEDVRSADFGVWFSRSNDRGLVISDVASRGAITKVGFREGDQIVSVNGQRVTRERDFNNYLFAEDVRRDRVKVIVLRDSREEIVYVEPTVFIEELQAEHHDPLEHFGVVLDDRYTDQIVVWKVIPRSSAYYAGIRAGDVLVSYRGERIASPTEFVRIVERTEPGLIAVEVNRDKKLRKLEVDVTRAGDQGESRTTLRPNLDEGVERRIERREDRREDRKVVVPPTDATPPAVKQPADVKRPGLIPRPLDRK